MCVDDTVLLCVTVLCDLLLTLFYMHLSFVLIAEKEGCVEWANWKLLVNVILAK